MLRLSVYYTPTYFCMKQFKKHHEDTQPAEEPVLETEIQTVDKPKVYTWGFWAAIAVFGLMALIMEAAMRLI